MRFDEEALQVTPPLRVGELAFVSGWPVQWPLRNGLPGAENAVLRTGLPGDLDGWMAAGELDVSPVSSLAYMRHRDAWKMLPGLSISAWGRLGSATLLSHEPFQGLGGATVAVPARGGTSTELVRWLMERVFGVDAAFVEHEGAPDELLRAHAAVLLIGDRAVQAAAQDLVPHRLDLGQAWWQLTQTPFVTTVWACRRSLRAEVQASLTSLLARSRETARAAMPTIISEAAQRLGLKPEALEAYYALLNFDMSPAHEQAMQLLAEQLGSEGAA
ncbi:MAG: menaquinone biosynthesis protein [Candidatus Sericytochromatia bacterium]|nr:menaquinone biosynthesis protein [Candidatus Sericytochromatia bacterium]